VRTLPLALDELLQRRPGGHALQPPRLLVEPLQRLQLLVVAEPRRRNRLLQHRDGPVVHPQRHREGVAVLAAVRERKAGRIGEAARRAVQHLGHRGERLHRARADARSALPVRAPIRAFSIPSWTR